MSNLNFFDNLRQSLMGLIGFSGRRLTYQEDGRSGYIFYREGATEFRMYWEFGGSKTLVIIDVPTEAQWTEQTRLPLERREEVLRYVAENVIRDKCSGRHDYRLEPDALLILA